MRNLTGDWLRRVEERFAGVNGEGVKSLLQNFSSLNVGNLVTFKFGSKFSETESWFQTLAGSALMHRA